MLDLGLGLGTLSHTPFGGMKCGMRIKTSVTLSRETLDSLEELAGEGLSKSRIVEIAVADLLERHRRRRRDAGSLDARAIAALDRAIRIAVAVE